MLLRCILVLTLFGQAAKGLFSPQANVQPTVAYELRACGKLRNGDLDEAIADFDRVRQLNSQRVHTNGIAPTSLAQVGSSSHMVPVRIVGVKCGAIVWRTKQSRLNSALPNTHDFEFYGKVLDVAKFYMPPQVIIFRPDTTVERVTATRFGFVTFSFNGVKLLKGGLIRMPVSDASRRDVAEYF
jgi:hypothetical protein